MSKHFIKTKYVLLSMFYGMMVTVPAVADDIEIYTSAATATTVATQANILFVLDTSGSMDTLINSRAPYDPLNDYAGGSGCYNKDRVYSMISGYSFLTSNSSGTTNAEILCGFSSGGFETYVNRVDKGSVKCDAASSLNTTGFYSGRVSQYRSGSWRNNIATKDDGKFIECEADAGKHGETTGDPKVWASNDVTQWSLLSASAINWGTVGTTTTLMNGNYLNYIINEPLTTTETRMEVMQEVISDLVDSMSGVNVGLMRFSSNGKGGMVTVPIGDIDANRATLQSELAAMEPGGVTPLSGSLYEAAMYYDGKAVDYGLASTESSGGSNSSYPSVSSSRSGSSYDSPILDECQKNFVLLLTDGDPVDDLLNGSRKANVGIASSSCGAVDDIPSNCLDEIAASIVEPIDGVREPINTYTVGFAVDNTLLTDTAAAGKGEKYLAADKVELQEKLMEFIGNVENVDTTFSSPAVSVNAFNRSVHLNDLYFTLFKPANSPHWAGNFKKYKLLFDTSDPNVAPEPFIADITNVNAIDDTSGYFKETAQSYWSGAVDGSVVTEGGTASNFTSSRKVFTFTGSYTNNSGVFAPAADAALTASVNSVSRSNSVITESTLGIVGASDVEVDSTNVPRREALLDWASGIDIFDDDGDSDYTDPRLSMGDPLHSQPALVQYDETAGVPELIAYVATNDGYLHAFDTKTGTEKFSFIPQELLTNLNETMENDPGNMMYGLDGDVVAWINDIDKNGTIDGSDHVYLYVGMRRGGKNIYSVDVTNPDSPALRWVIKGGVGDYAELGQTWSTVNVEKIKDGSTEKTVLIFGGGYDTRQDSASIRSSVISDSVGRAVFIADASTGELLWSAGPGGDLALGDMDYSIPARVKPLDLKGDGFIDRLYVSDTGGQIFRFDIDNSSGSLAASIDGGRIADLATDGSAVNARRFYYPPDVALIAERGETPYLALSIASGYRAHPLNTTIQDRMYLLKDKAIYNKPTSYETITESSLYNATLNLVGGNGTEAQNNVARAELGDVNNDGWYIKLDDQTNTNTWVGEKGMSETLMLEGTMIVTTFIPTDVSSGTGCGPKEGNGRVYYIDILDGSPTYLSDLDIRDERYKELKRGGIPPGITPQFTKEGNAGCIGTECSTIEVPQGVRKTYWYEVEK